MAAGHHERTQRGNEVSQSDRKKHGEDSHYGRESPPAMPRWVKVFILIIVVVLAMLVLLKIVGGGGHGPGRHRTPADTAQTQQSRP